MYEGAASGLGCAFVYTLGLFALGAKPGQIGIGVARPPRPQSLDLPPGVLDGYAVGLKSDSYGVEQKKHLFPGAS